jgi:hypothetical protein
VRGKSATHFDPEIFDGHQLQLEFLTEGAIISAILGKSSGRLALEFTLAEYFSLGQSHFSPRQSAAGYAGLIEVLDSFGVRGSLPLFQQSRQGLPSAGI